MDLQDFIDAINDPNSVQTVYSFPDPFDTVAVLSATIAVTDDAISTALSVLGDDSWPIDVHEAACDVVAAALKNLTNSFKMAGLVHVSINA